MLGGALIFGIVCALIAAGKSRSVVGWFFVGLFTNLIGLIIILVLEERDAGPRVVTRYVHVQPNASWRPHNQAPYQGGQQGYVPPQPMHGGQSSHTGYVSPYATYQPESPQYAGGPPRPWQPHQPEPNNAPPAPEPRPVAPAPSQPTARQPYPGSRFPASARYSPPRDNG